MRVFSGAWPAEEQGYGELLRPEVVDSIYVQRVRVPRLAQRRRVTLYNRELARYCRRRGQRPDVLQLLNIYPWSTHWFGVLKLAGVPLVYTHTMIRTGSLGWVKDGFNRLPYRFLDRVVVSTGVMRDSLAAEGVACPITVIPNGVDLRQFRPLRSAAERRQQKVRLGFRPEEELVVFVGGFLKERKGVDVLAEAWHDVARRRPCARLVLIGARFDALRDASAQEAFQSRVMDSLKASGARDRVTFTGKVENVQEFLQVADVFVFPSRREGMPNVVPEAFGCGAASVITPFTGLPEEFGAPGREYVLVDRTPPAVAGAVVALLEDPARREALRRRARRWVERNLDLEASLDAYAVLYRELAARGNRRVQDS